MWLRPADGEAEAAPSGAARVLAVVDIGSGLVVRLGAYFITHPDRLLVLLSYGGSFGLQGWGDLDRCQTAARTPFPNSDGMKC